MKLDRYIKKGNKKLRYGYTTGSCAAGAAKAAAWMLLSDKAIETIELSTPKGWPLKLDIRDITISDNAVSCAVQKDSGDDPDVTNGMLIYAKVSRQKKGVEIVGGKGIGIVTQKGLGLPVGEAAINKTPKHMISQAVSEAIEAAGYGGGLCIEIYAPEGETIGRKTFNQRLGIEGGISILGTTGIVEPMSEQALTASLKIEMDVLAEKRRERVLLCPGNYGWAFAEETLGLNMDYCIKVSNYIGDMLDHARDCEFKTLLFVAHIGKAVKLAGGIMNTHSKFADCRAEIMAAHALRCGADGDIAREILNCVTSDAMTDVLFNQGLLESVVESLSINIEAQMSKRVFEKIKTGIVLFSHERGLLGMGDTAVQIIEDFKNGKH